MRVRRREFDRQQARIGQLRACCDLLAEALMKHDRWCGHHSDAPGDSIYHEAMEEYQKMLASPHAAGE